MPIKAQTADGVIHEFPDDTPQAAVDKAMKSYTEEQRAKQPGLWERLGMGAMDPIYGAAQLGARMSEPGEEIGAAIGGVDLEKDKAERQKTIDDLIRRREADYEKRRGPNAGFDLARLGGSLPTSAALTAPAMALGGIPGAVAAGAMGGALQPATGPSFGTEKAGQTAAGAALGGAFGVAGKALGAGVRGLGEYLAREYPENVTTQAITKILKRLSQDEKAGSPGAQAAIDLINEANKAGKPVTLADVSGENTRALAGNVARQPGESRNIAAGFLNTRDEAAATRLSADVGKYVHGGPSMHQTAEALLNARSAAGVGYKDLATMDVIPTPRLMEFLGNPDVRKGLVEGLNIERNVALAEGRPFSPMRLGIDLDAEGNIKIAEVPSMAALDMAKRGLDAMIAGERNEITGRLSARGVALDRMRRAYVETLDQMDRTGAYKAARASWAGYSQSLDALRAGRTLLQRSPEEIGAEFADLTPNNQEFYRLGVADMLRERLAKSGLGSDEARSLIKNPWVRDQLRPIFRSPAEFDAFVNSVATETRMFGTRRAVLGGSQTAGRLAEDESGENLLTAGGAEIAEKMMRGSWLGAVRSAVRMYRELGVIRSNPKLNEEIARIVFQTPIDPMSELALRLTGKLAAPPPINRLGPLATGVQRAAVGASPAAAATAAQPSMTPADIQSILDRQRNAPMVQ